MRTTRRSSSRTAARPGVRTGVRVGACALLAALLAGCATGPKTTPKELFQLTPESGPNKAMQTRTFETRDSDELLSASAAVLQDLGFQVTEADKPLGFLRAAKERSAREYGQEVSRGVVAFLTLVLSAFGGSNAMVVMPVDLQQQINASLVAMPLSSAAAAASAEADAGDGVRSEVRIVFYRLVWKGDGQSGDNYIPPGQQKMEMIRDAALYQQFFARLSKAVFLEAEKI